MIVGAVLALLLRAVLFLPADLYARVLARGNEIPRQPSRRRPAGTSGESGR